LAQADKAINQNIERAAVRTRSKIQPFSLRLLDS
jgi:hypothetical protein